jgi:hypothetical protein
MFSFSFEPTFQDLCGLTKKNINSAKKQDISNSEPNADKRKRTESPIERILKPKRHGRPRPESPVCQMSRNRKLIRLMWFGGRGRGPGVGKD